MKITLVDAIIKASRVNVRLVCNEEKEEKSIGSLILKAAKSMTKENAKLKDNRTSNNNTGNGRKTNNNRINMLKLIELYGLTNDINLFVLVADDM